MKTAKKFSGCIFKQCFFSHIFLRKPWGYANDDTSSEEHFENSKTIRGSYLLLQVVIFVQIFEFYLVTIVPLSSSNIKDFFFHHFLKFLFVDRSVFLCFSSLKLPEIFAQRLVHLFA
jgi:hypothetical protein